MKQSKYRSFLIFLLLKRLYQTTYLHIHIFPNSGCLTNIESQQIILSVYAKPSHHQNKCLPKTLKAFLKRTRSYFTVSCKRTSFCIYLETSYQPQICSISHLVPVKVVISSRVTMLQWDSLAKMHIIRPQTYL